MIRELLNVFTKGTKGVKVVGDPKISSLNIPVNEDWSFVTKITQFDDLEIPIVSGQKVWDQSASPKTFQASAKYSGQNGSPTGSENVQVQPNSYVPFRRVGTGNSFADFVAFFGNARHSCCAGIPALVLMRTNDFVSVPNVTMKASCFKLPAGSSFFQYKTSGAGVSRYQRIISYNIIKNSTPPILIEVLALDPRKIIMPNNFSPSQQWTAITTTGYCDGQTSTFNGVGTVKLVPAIVDFGSGDETVWMVTDNPNLSFINVNAECCGPCKVSQTIGNIRLKIIMSGVVVFDENLSPFFPPNPAPTDPCSWIFESQPIPFQPACVTFLTHYIKVGTVTLYPSTGRIITVLGQWFVYYDGANPIRHHFETFGVFCDFIKATPFDSPYTNCSGSYSLPTIGGTVLATCWTPPTADSGSFFMEVLPI